MSLLAIDIETFSDVDLTKCGVYAYSDSPNFEVLLFAYAFDDEETQVVDLARGEQLPDRVLSALEDPAIIKSAFNAAFERTCLSHYLGHRLSPEGVAVYSRSIRYAGPPPLLGRRGRGIEHPTEKAEGGSRLGPVLLHALQAH